MIKILLSKKLGAIRWTQADLARVTGIRPNTIGELYHEMTIRVNLEHLNLICEACAYVTEETAGKITFNIFMENTGTFDVSAELSELLVERNGTEI